MLHLIARSSVGSVDEVLPHPSIFHSVKVHGTNLLEVFDASIEVGNLILVLASYLAFFRWSSQDNSD